MCSTETPGACGASIFGSSPLRQGGRQSHSGGESGTESWTRRGCIGGGGGAGGSALGVKEHSFIYMGKHRTLFSPRAGSSAMHPLSCPRLTTSLSTQPPATFHLSGALTSEGRLQSHPLLLVAVSCDWGVVAA